MEACGRPGDANAVFKCDFPFVNCYPTTDSRVAGIAHLSPNVHLLIPDGRKLRPPNIRAGIWPPPFSGTGIKYGRGRLAPSPLRGSS